MPGGRPTKFTEERCTRFVEALRAGHFIKVAAGLAGWSERVVNKYLARGHKEATAGDDTPYVQFMRAASRALWESEQELVAKIREAATGADGQVVRTVTRPLIVLGVPVLDEHKQPVMVTETTVETRREFDWRAARFLLETRHRSRYGSQMALTGRVVHEHRVKMSAEDEAVASSIAARRLGAAVSN